MRSNRGFYMKTFDLARNAQWQIRGVDPATTTPDKLAPPAPQAGDWLPAIVPGDINADLLRHGRMPDPHRDDQARGCYWVTAQDWWYRAVFDAPDAGGTDATLIFEVLDGISDVYLNGAFLGTADNAFHPWRFDVGKLLQPRDNRLYLRFRSIDRFFGGPRTDDLTGWPGKCAFLRKPQFSFGWDWALPLPSLGIGGAARLEFDHALCLTDFALQPFASGRVDFAFEVSRAVRQAGYEIEVAVAGHHARETRRLDRLAGRSFSGHGADGSEAPAAPFKSYCSIQIPNPQLWQPNGFGAQPLYDYTVRLLVAGREVDRRRGRLGLRETQVIEEPFTPPFDGGMSFHIAVNNEKIFCKGSNWAPLELWPATAAEEQYRFYLRLAREAGFNMLRVWGGGIYEREIFYNLCDEYGIMVWQDFMFASSGYPLDRLRDSIIREAEFQIRRLRNHPCLALWCGCNEDIYSWQHPLDQAAPAGGQQDTGVYAVESARAGQWQVNRLRDDPRLYGILLRGLTGRLGLGAPYVESSPASRDDRGNMPWSGNCHISAWKYALFQAGGHPENFRRHFEQVCAFNSEFCDQGPCSVAAFRRFFSEQNLWPPNDVWTYHVQRGHKRLPHHEQTLRIAGGIFGPINSLADYVKFGQAAHLEMTRCEFEAARRDRPNRGGTMSWMFNDCWPTANWSIIDYYRAPKPAYYASKRACAPVLAIVFPRAGQIEFFLDNQTPRAGPANAIYGVATLAGKRLWEKQQTLEIPANQNLMVDRLPESAVPVPPDAYWFMDAEIDGQALPRQCYFPRGWKDVPWPNPTITTQCSGKNTANPADICAPIGAGLPPGRSDRGEGTPSPKMHAKTCWTTEILIKTDVFARLCHVCLMDSSAPDTPLAVVEYSDNYFDLPAGATHSLTITAPVAPTMQHLRVGHWRGAWM